MPLNQGGCCARYIEVYGGIWRYMEVYGYCQASWLPSRLRKSHSMGRSHTMTGLFFGGVHRKQYCVTTSKVIGRFFIFI